VVTSSGYKIEKTSSSYWYEPATVYQAFPYHWIIQPAEEELLTFSRIARLSLFDTQLRWIILAGESVITLFTKNQRIQWIN